MYTTYMTIYLVIFLPKTPYIHRIYKWFWLTLIPYPTLLTGVSCKTHQHTLTLSWRAIHGGNHTGPALYITHWRKTASRNSTRTYTHPPTPTPTPTPTHAHTQIHTHANNSCTPFFSAYLQVHDGGDAAPCICRYLLQFSLHIGQHAKGKKVPSGARFRFEKEKGTCFIPAHIHTHTHTHTYLCQESGMLLHQKCKKRQTQLCCWPWPQQKAASVCDLQSVDCDVKQVWIIERDPAISNFSAGCCSKLSTQSLPSWVWWTQMCVQN